MKKGSRSVPVGRPNCFLNKQHKTKQTGACIKNIFPLGFHPVTLFQMLKSTRVERGYARHMDIKLPDKLSGSQW